VLLEQDLENKIGEGHHPFLDAIRGELWALVNAENPIPEELLQLLRRRRVLVILDHFSELPVNAFVVTSRLEEQLDGVPKTTIRPLR
jgi:hypothetical protein